MLCDVEDRFSMEAKQKLRKNFQYWRSLRIETGCWRLNVNSFCRLWFHSWCRQRWWIGSNRASISLGPYFAVGQWNFLQKFSQFLQNKVHASNSSNNPRWWAPFSVDITSRKRVLLSINQELVALRGSFSFWIVSVHLAISKLMFLIGRTCC